MNAEAIATAENMEGVQAAGVHRTLIATKAAERGLNSLCIESDNEVGTA